MAPVAKESPRVEVLHPVDEAVRHHVERHLELGLGGLLAGQVADEGLEGAEGERVHEDRERPPAEKLHRPGAHVAPPLVVGGVHVEEMNG